MDTDGELKERKIKYIMVLPIGGGEDTNPENMEDLYTWVRSWGREEEDNTTFPYWKAVD